MKRATSSEGTSEVSDTDQGFNSSSSFFEQLNDNVQHYLTQNENLMERLEETVVDTENKGDLKIRRSKSNSNRGLVISTGARTQWENDFKTQFSSNQDSTRKKNGLIRRNQATKTSSPRSPTKNSRSPTVFSPNLRLWFGDTKPPVPMNKKIK